MPMESQIQHGLQAADEPPTLSAGRTKSINIAHVHQGSGAWFFWGVGLPSVLIKRLDKVPIGELIYRIDCFSWFSFLPVLQPEVERMNESPSKWACMRLRWVLARYYLWGRLLS